jgi:hypothetical protein
VRIDKIARIIEDCKYGVHDISRTAPDQGSGSPRFNMPFELGLFLGARWFGRGRQQRKVGLVLDSAQYRYQQFVSDIAGQDIKAHSNDPGQLITALRKWLRTSSGVVMPGGAEVFRRYGLFREGLPLLCEQLRLRPEEMTFNDYADLISTWIATE